MVVAAGPFCCKEDALYEPLQALLSHCKTHLPDVLVLMGPFVDVDHPLVQAGMLETSFEELFASQVRPQQRCQPQPKSCQCKEFDTDHNVAHPCCQCL